MGTAGPYGDDPATGPNLTLQNCYNIGLILNVSNPGGMGGLVGTFAENGVVTFKNAYSLSLPAGANWHLYPVPADAVKTPAEMRSAETLAALGDAFAACPDKYDVLGYPLLDWQVPAPTPEQRTIAVKEATAGGAGDYATSVPVEPPRQSGVYYIRTPANYRWLENQVNSGATTFAGETLALETNLDFTGVTGVPPIGGNVAEANEITQRRFSGSFYGQRHALINLDIVSDVGRSNIGVFGTVDSALIIGLQKLGGSVQAEEWNTGGIVGWAIGNTRIYQCCNTGTVTAAHDNVGGIAGNIAGAATEISQCYNTGAIRARTSSGGLVGVLNGGVCSDHYNFGDITASSSVAGGLIGWAQPEKSGINIYRCLNLGTVTGTKNGTLVGCTVQSSVDPYAPISAEYLLALSKPFVGDAGSFYFNLGAPPLYDGMKTPEQIKNLGDGMLNYSNQYNYQTGQIVADYYAVFKPDVNNINGGYPVLWWQ